MSLAEPMAAARATGVRVVRSGECTQLLVTPNSLTIPVGQPRRLSPRPSALRIDGYDDKFDADTLFYDVFRSGNKVIAIGPPLLNLDEAARGWHYDADGRRLAPPRVVGQDRIHRATFAADRTAREIGLSTIAGTRDSVSIGADLAPVFAGTRAISTLQLDNDLQWIRDWVRWHRNAQGTDAVVVYDNGSSRYSHEELLASIALPGIRAAAVVDWSFRFGPLGSDRLPWDSDFAQYGEIEHARRRLLRSAAGMLSVDIDEMVRPIDGKTVYQIAAESAFGIARFAGRWAYADPDRVPSSPRHIDCRWERPSDSDAEHKWCAVPRRLPERAQLKIHGVHGLPAPHGVRAGYWHMRPISTSWRFDRTRPHHEAASYVRSADLERQLQTYLGESAPERSSPSVSLRTPGVAVRRFADLLSYARFHLREYVHRLRTAH